MAGTWMSIVEGFGGMRMKNGKLSFTPQIPKQWKSYSFKINFRNQILKVNVNQEMTRFTLDSGPDLAILVYDQPILVRAGASFKSVQAPTTREERGLKVNTSIK